MTNLNNTKYKNLTFYLAFSLIIFLLIIFILEVVYYLPSPTGDSLWFLKASFNICRDDAFVVTNYDLFAHNSEKINYTHGWFGPYVQGKLNFDCSLRGLFLFSFFIKLFTSFFLFLYFKLNKANRIYSFIIILTTFLIQLKLQFRLETFAILLYSILFYYFEKKNYLISGFIISLMLFSQPTLFVIISLIAFLIFFNQIKRNLLFVIFGFSLGFFILLYIYPYTFVDYLIGLWSHKGAMVNQQTLLNGGLNTAYIYNLFRYWIIAPFYPFSGIVFLLLIFRLIKKKPIVSLSLPILFFFGPNSPSVNYVLLSLIPFISLACLNLDKGESKSELNDNKLHIVILLVTILGFTQYFTRNILTVVNYPNQIFKTKIFLLNNLDSIERFPGFAFMLDKKFKFISIGEKREDNFKYKYKTFSVNGSRNICPNEQLNKFEKHHLKIFSYKIFSSNAGYGIWICKI
tara:strand:+ start:219 stop:1595 length:1377 start_codon:yes stop_codon:yes gene_type:complete